MSFSTVEEKQEHTSRANDKQKLVTKNEEKIELYDTESKLCQRLKYILHNLTFKREDQNTAVLRSVERVSSSLTESLH